MSGACDASPEALAVKLGNIHQEHMLTPSTTISCAKTRLALFWMHLANEPFVAVFTMLGFILKKDLGASALQISLLATINPALALISFYLGAYLSQWHHRYVPNLMVAWLSGRLLFLVLPFYCNIWTTLVAACLYQLFQRACAPNTLEILRKNLDRKEHLRFFSWVYFFSFLESLILGFFIGKFLDTHTNNWKVLLALSSLFSLTSLFFQHQIPTPSHSTEDPVEKKKLHFLQPFKDSYRLMQSSQEFAKFQAGFMCGGLGLMIMNPALIVFYHDHLNLSHQTMATGRFLWMGAGVLLSTFVWKTLIHQIPLPKLLIAIITGFAIFPLAVLYASEYFFFLYLAFFIYGVAQAGSHLIWHLSGIFFAQDQQSSAMYTATNILAVGLRGLIGPCLGGILTEALGPHFTLIVGSTVCFSGIYCMFLIQNKNFKNASL
jgi:MFS family permease